MNTQEPLLQRLDGVPEEMIIQTAKLRAQIYALLKEEGDCAVAKKKNTRNSYSIFQFIKSSSKKNG